MKYTVYIHAMNEVPVQVQSFDSLPEAGRFLNGLQKVYPSGHFSITEETIG